MRIKSNRENPFILMDSFAQDAQTSRLRLHLGEPILWHPSGSEVKGTRPALYAAPIPAPAAKIRLS
jgi:hypothetical protein